MIHFPLRRLIVALLVVAAIITVSRFALHPSTHGSPDRVTRLPQSDLSKAKFAWRDVPQKHPVQNYTALPNGPITTVPKIQAEFWAETRKESAERKRRLAAVKEAFLHSWEGYKKNAWMQDEVAPLTGYSHNDFGGWGATLVDSLDTLWIMGFEKDFHAALKEIRKIDFTSTPLDEVNVFETTIRYLGGLLSAYDVSGQKHDALLQKAVELGDMLYVAFDTPNRMPVTRWDWKHAAQGGDQEAARHTLLAEVGSLSLEFTRLSQLTGDHKWYDAIARITNALQEGQNHTKIPGLWPQLLDTQNLDFSKDITFTLGGMSDSFYEYFPKQHMMLGGRSDQYRDMYAIALESAKKRLFFQPLTPSNKTMLISGTLKRNSAMNVNLLPRGEHLTCFVGGMVALAARVFQRTKEIEIARQLVDGCLWAYDSMPSGVMPEVFTAVPCSYNCTWSVESWHEAVSLHASKYASAWEEPIGSAQIIINKSLPPGLVDIQDPRYNLRPEAIESVFVLYRITGDKSLQDKAWKMFQAISYATRTDIAFASMKDVTDEKSELSDSMESFWTAETLKYFYLIFSEPDVISLDDYILNTEAHPLLRPK